MTEQNDFEGGVVENGFATMGLPDPLMTNLMTMNFTTPTPIQKQAIPFALEGRDVLATAQTGTGKTGAFAIPVVARLADDPQAAALIMTPTRELATQILSVVRSLTVPGIAIRTALLIGGEGMEKQFTQLRASPRIIIGTPGRLNDHLRRDPALLENVNLVVLDEADRMLDMGFASQIDDVLEGVQEKRQMLMFSATFAPQIIRFSKAYMQSPQRIAIEPEQRTAARVIQETVHATDDQRYDVLVRELDARTGSIIVFVRTKHGADRLARRLERENHSADTIHGDLRQHKRDRAIAAFRAGKTRILVATDVAARGIDVPHVEHVINYDLPQVAEDYVHRIGRTARAGAEGRALSILMPGDNEKWNEILKIVDPDSADHAPRGRKGGKGGKSGKPRMGRPEGGAYKRKDGFNARRSGEGFSVNKGGKPFKKRENEAFNDNQGGQEERKSFKKPYGDKPRFEKRGDREERGNREDRPFKKGGFENRKPREDRGGFEGRGNREDRPFKKEGFENRKPREDRGGFEGRGNREDRPFKKEGFENRKPREDRGGFEGRGNREDRPFKKEGFENRKPREDRGGFEGRGNREDRPFKKGGFENRKPREDRGGFEGRGNREDRPQRAGGFEKRDGKPFGSKDEGGKARRGAGRFEKKEGGFKKDGFKKDGFKKGGFKGGKPGGFKGGSKGQPRKQAG